MAGPAALAAGDAGCVSESGATGDEIATQVQATAANNERNEAAIVFIMAPLQCK